MSRLEELEKDLKAVQDELEYFIKRYNEEKDDDVKDGLYFCVLIGKAGEAELKEQINSLNGTKMGEENGN